MSSDGVDNNRRRFLTAATVVVGAAGTVVAAVPFLSSWSPSARAKTAGAPVEANIGKLEPGQQIIVKWRGKPVWVVRRDEKALATLPKVADQLRDAGSDESKQPEYAKNEHRSRKPEYLIIEGICTHLGLFADLPARNHFRFPGRFLLPLSWFEVRFRRACLLGSTGTDKFTRSAALLCE